MTIHYFIYIYIYIKIYIYIYIYWKLCFSGRVCEGQGGVCIFVYIHTHTYIYICIYIAIHDCTSHYSLHLTVRNVHLCGRAKGLCAHRQAAFVHVASVHVSTWGECTCVYVWVHVASVHVCMCEYMWRVYMCVRVSTWGECTCVWVHVASVHVCMCEYMWRVYMCVRVSTWSQCTCVWVHVSSCSHAPRQTFSKVSSLVILQGKLDSEWTFENLYLHVAAGK